MAETILSTVAQWITLRLGSSAVQEFGLFWGVEDELQQLKETISTIKGVLLDAEEKQVHNHQVRIWLGRLEGAVYEADDLLDDFSIEALRWQIMVGNNMAKKVCTFFSTSNQVVFRFKTGQRIRDVRKKLAVIAADRRDFHLEVRYEEIEVVSKVREQTHSFILQDEIIGRDDDRLAILELLLEGKFEENVSVIPIVGMGGVGKTALAQLVFNDEKIKQHFELKMWVCISDVFDLKQILRQIIKSATNNNPEDLDMDQLQNLLRRRINGKRYLLVLDDVWNESRERWLSLKDLLANGGEGSRILVTTRSKMVAEISSSVQPYRLGILDEDKSWSLFKRMAFKRREEPKNFNVREIGMEIVRRCGGVPLAIRSIGSMLYFRNPETEWSSFNTKLSKISQKKNDYVLQTLELSFKHLSSHLKHCFAYCSLFPKDYEFSVQTLINLWMAQGFFMLSESIQCPEEEGYECFMHLLDRSFFQEVKRDKWGNVESCKMHDLMHDLAIEVAGMECVTLSSQREMIRNKTRHVSFNGNLSAQLAMSLLFQASRNIRTIIFPGSTLQENNKLIKSILDHKSLRALDLRASGIKIVPSSIGKLKHLRYLDLSLNKNIKALPNSITNLPNLQTLKLRSCYGLESLPRGIKKLVNLRHLDNHSCLGLTHMPSGLGQLINLQTLPQFVLSKETDSVNSRHVAELNELTALNNLRGELQISGLKHGKEASSHSNAANLKDKQHLKSLRLVWDYRIYVDEQEAIIVDEMLLEGLLPHQNLRELVLRNYCGINLSSWLPSLTSLVELSLDSCKNCQHLPPLNQFHSLKVLELQNLHALEYISSNSPSSSSPMVKVLPSLREISLIELPKLKGWWKNENSLATSSMEEKCKLPSFPILSKLIIQSCPELTLMPLFPHIEKELVLNNTSWKPFEQTMMNKKNIKPPQIPIPSSSSSSSISGSSFSPLCKLKKLSISNNNNLQNLPNWFETLTSIQQLYIVNCPKLEKLSPGISHLQSLQELQIRNCEEFEISNRESSMWASLKSLQSLKLSGFPKLGGLPEGIEQLTSLQELCICGFDSLTTIPEWVRSLKSLRELHLLCCPNLASLPGDLTTLNRLVIEHCPILLWSCRRGKGHDWPKIAHIPELFMYPDPDKDHSCK